MPATVLDGQQALVTDILSYTVGKYEQKNFSADGSSRAMTNRRIGAIGGTGGWSNVQGLGRTRTANQLDLLKPM